MIREIRSAAGTIVSAALLIAGCGLGAHAAGVAASEGVSRAELYGTLGAAGVVVFAAFWTLLTSSTSRMERSVDGLVKAIEMHQVDAEAHPRAITSRSRPLLEKLESLDAKQDEVREALAMLIAEHRVIRGVEDDVCKFVRSMSIPRDPNDSPSPRRKDDSDEDDFRPVRGKP